MSLIVLFLKKKHIAVRKFACATKIFFGPGNKLLWLTVAMVESSHYRISLACSSNYISSPLLRHLSLRKQKEQSC